MSTIVRKQLLLELKAQNQVALSYANENHDNETQVGNSKLTRWKKVPQITNLMDTTFMCKSVCPNNGLVGLYMQSTKLFNLTKLNAN